MAEVYQLDLFKDTDISRLEADIKESRLATDRVRRGMFARLGDLQKKYDELIWEYDCLKKAICKGDKQDV